MDRHRPRASPRAGRGGRASQRRGVEPPDKERCADAYEASQKLERAGKLIEALAETSLCAHEACPAVLRAECTQWFSPLRARQSSLVVEAYDAGGGERFDVTVSVDGAVARERLDGRAFFLNPGPHRLAFRTEGGERASQNVVVREGSRADASWCASAPRERTRAGGRT